VRPDRVIAGFALIVILALVAVPGTVGHQTSLATVSAQAFQRVVLNRAEGTVASTFDPANRSASAVAASATLIEPADTVVVRARPSAALSAAGGSVAVPTRPIRLPATSSRSEPSGGGGGGGGGWRSSPSSWYGPGLYGNGTACGQTLTKGLVGVAHKTLPCGTVVEFRNPTNGRVVAAQVVDRGPYVAGRTWDLTHGLCAKLDHCYTAPIQWRLP
jgi:Lytic transglycolase